MKLILLGAPGAGKGTQAEYIGEMHGIPAISTGEILRAAMKAGSPLGRKARVFVEAGELVPDEVVISLLKERLQQPDCAKGFILDGFPRNISQAEALESMGVSIDRVLSIEVPDEEIIDRMAGRRVCSSCASSYHTRYNPPQADGVCDKCGGQLMVRDDDKPATVSNRLKVFHDQTEPLKEYYFGRGLLKIIIGQEEVEDTKRETCKALEGLV